MYMNVNEYIKFILIQNNKDDDLVCLFELAKLANLTFPYCCC